MLRKLLLATALALPLVSMVGGCADTDTPADLGPIDDDGPDLTAGDDFVALPRAVDAGDAARRRSLMREAGMPGASLFAADERDFYIGIHKDALAERWFMSAFLEQYFPGAVLGGAASSLGTRVVSFKIQNGKLFVVDASDRHATSEVFDPEVLVEAYPIVDNAYTRSRPGSRDYVFFDPAAGVAKFDLLRDAFGSSYSMVRFDRTLTFNRNFRKLDDGATFQQVFTGSADVPIADGQIEPDVFRASGTLGLSIRKYKEGAQYQEVALPAQEHFFRSDPKLTIGSDQPVQTAAHWDIHPGMRPIEWVIAPELKALDDSPEFADVDLVGAVKAGIEGWNQAFGFQVFKARVANPGESFGQDDKNYIIFDPDSALGFAFANWRTNPNTGEIRGASVYFDTVWLDRTYITADPGDEDARPARREIPKVASLRWGGMHAEPLCVRWAQDAHAERGPVRGGDRNLTVGQKLERSVSNMIVHEIGHDLGLRHNFAGSLTDEAPGSTSVMDYTLFDTSVAQAATPGTYDVAAVRYLYGLSSELPTQAFCTDDAVGLIPECQVFDTSADPFTATYQPDYLWIRNYFTRNGLPEFFLWAIEQFARPVFDFAVNGDPDQAARGLSLLLDEVSAPLSPALLADPTFSTTGADLVLRENLRLLAAQPNPAIIDAVEDQAGLVLRNVDGIRSAKTRRAMVDLLKARQTNRAYGKLLLARNELQGQLQLGTLTGDAALEARDLLARIDRATAPYFE